MYPSNATQYGSTTHYPAPGMMPTVPVHQLPAQPGQMGVTAPLMGGEAPAAAPAGFNNLPPPPPYAPPAVQQPGYNPNYPAYPQKS